MDRVVLQQEQFLEVLCFRSKNISFGEYFFLTKGSKFQQGNELSER